MDFFCGLGNFSLPVARRGARVTGVEGVAAMAATARAHAQNHGLADLAEFQAADLFAVTPQQLARWARADKWLLDPPRSGAQALVTALLGPHWPKRIVYVSCNPATLARDAAILVGKGYAVRAGGVFNMFPQTAHVESMMVFERSAAT